MSRPRIRTLKPEFWQDEKVGQLSRDARLLVLGLLTMADDEGRLRALPSAILGHVFPYDQDAPRRLRRWLGEVERTGIILCYEAANRPYVAFRHWRRHQKINRPTASLLPPPPDPAVVTENAVSPPDSLTEPSVNEHGASTERSSPRARACAGADRIGSRKGSEELTPSAPQGSARAGENGLASQVDEVLAIMAQAPRLWLDRVAVENAIATEPKKDPIPAAHAAVARGRDPNQRITNGALVLAYCLRQQPERSAPSDPGAPVSAHERAKAERQAARAAHIRAAAQEASA